MSTTHERPRIGLAFGGGGARGLAHLGITQRLLELGIPIHCVAGTSIGSVMGAVFASGSLDRAFAWCHEPDWKKLSRLLLDRPLTRKAVIQGTRIEELLADLIPARTFDELACPFAAVATDLQTGEEVVLDHGSLQTAIRASISIPGVFPPVERDGRILVDGSLVTPVPVAVCRRLDADKVIAVDVNPPLDVRAQKPFDQMTIFDILVDTFRITNAEMTRHLLRDAPPDVLLRPDVGMVKTLDFRNAPQLIARGRQCVDAIQTVFDAWRT